MAYRAPAVFQDENLPLRRGKGVDGVKTDMLKTARSVRQDRRALRDLSNTGKPSVSVASKGSALKDKSAARARETTKNGSKSSFLTSEEIRKCHEWAKEGIEHVHFTGNDLQRLQKDRDEQRVRKKVGKVMSALHEWSNMAYDHVMPLKEVAKDTEDIGDVIKMNLEPEALPLIPSLPSASDKKEIEDDIFEFDDDILPYAVMTIEFKLKDGYNLESETPPPMTSLLSALGIGGV